MRLIPNRSAFMNRQVMHGGWSTCAQVDAGAVGAVECVDAASNHP